MAEYEICPACGYKKGYWLDDPIKTEKGVFDKYGNAISGTIGSVYIKRSHFKELQVKRARQEELLEIPSTTFSSVGGEGEFFKPKKSHILELRQSTMKVLDKLEIPKWNYFYYDYNGDELIHYDENGNEYCQIDWHDPDFNAYKGPVRAVHIEDLRHPIVLYPELHVYHDSPEWGTNLTDRLNLYGCALERIEFYGNCTWADNVSTGVEVGEIRLRYKDGTFGSISLVIGVNIAEWSCDRPEMNDPECCCRCDCPDYPDCSWCELGKGKEYCCTRWEEDECVEWDECICEKCLRHKRPIPAWSYWTHIDSEYWYKGHYWLFSLNIPEGKRVDYIELVLNSQAYTGQESWCFALPNMFGISMWQDDLSINFDKALFE